MIITLTDVVEEVENQLANSLRRRNLDEYVITTEFDKIYKKIDEMTKDLEMIIKSMGFCE